MPQFGDELAEVLRRLGASVQDVDGLRLEGNNIGDAASLVRSWTGQSGDIDAKVARFDALDCNLGPHDMIAVRLYDTPNFQSIANSSETNVVFSELRALWGNVFSWSASDPTVINVRDLPEVPLIRVSGSCVWATDGTGYRYTVLAPYDADGVLLTPGVARTLTTTGAVTGVQTTYSYADGIHRVPGVNKMSTIKLRVGQTSGGNLNLEYASCMVELVGSVRTS